MLYEVGDMLEWGDKYQGHIIIILEKIISVEAETCEYRFFNLTLQEEERFDADIIELESTKLG